MEKKKKKALLSRQLSECHFKSYFRAYVMMCVILIHNETQINNSMEWQNLLEKVKKIYIVSPNLADHFFSPRCSEKVKTTTMQFP